MDDITLRLATMQDVDLVFEWRNAWEVRKYCLDNRPLKKSEHIVWFEKSLKLTDRCTLIAEHQKNPLGVLRFNFKELTAEIDIYLDPKEVGQGWGTTLLSQGEIWLQKFHPQIKMLEATVLVDNIASQRVFEKTGFLPKIIVYQKKIDHS